MQPHKVYQRTTDLGGASARDAEILALTLAGSRLERADDAASRISALFHNNQLWLALVSDLSSDNNRLPSPLRGQLIDLGFWAMRYGRQAMHQPIPLDPLIAVNRNIADGLRQQTVHTPAARAPDAQSLHSQL